jgi:hypothetical protein
MMQPCCGWFGAPVRSFVRSEIFVATRATQFPSPVGAASPPACCAPVFRLKRSKCRVFGSKTWFCWLFDGLGGSLNHSGSSLNHPGSFGSRPGSSSDGSGSFRSRPGSSPNGSGSFGSRSGSSPNGPGSSLNRSGSFGNRPGRLKNGSAGWESRRKGLENSILACAAGAPSFPPPSVFPRALKMIVSA